MKIGTYLLFPQKFAPNIKSKIDQKQPKIDIVARFSRAFPKNQHQLEKQHQLISTFSTILQLCSTDFFVTTRGPKMWYMRQSSTKLQRPCQTRVHTVTRWRRGNSMLNNIFYRHFFLVIRGKCFYSCTSSPISICALLERAFQDNKRYTKLQIFYAIIETYPSTLAAPVDISGRLQTNHMHCPQNKQGPNKVPKCK